MRHPMGGGGGVKLESQTKILFASFLFANELPRETGLKLLLPYFFSLFSLLSTSANDNLDDQLELCAANWGLNFLCKLAITFLETSRFNF